MRKTTVKTPANCAKSHGFKPGHICSQFLDIYIYIYLIQYSMIDDDSNNMANMAK